MNITTNGNETRNRIQLKMNRNILRQPPDGLLGTSILTGGRHGNITIVVSPSSSSSAFFSAFSMLSLVLFSGVANFVSGMVVKGCCGSDGGGSLLLLLIVVLL